MGRLRKFVWGLGEGIRLKPFNRKSNDRNRLLVDAISKAKIPHHESVEHINILKTLRKIIDISKYRVRLNNDEMYAHIDAALVYYEYIAKSRNFELNEKYDGLRKSCNDIAGSKNRTFKKRRFRDLTPKILELYHGISNELIK